jgi:hypothetical protein
MEFFKKSDEQFQNPEFKQLLRMGKSRGQDPQDLVNSMQHSIFENMGVQGDFGIKCLSRIRQVHT